MTNSNWRTVLRTNFTDWRLLADFLQLPHALGVETSFRLNVPRRLAEKMEKGNAQDPLLLQFLPAKEELEKTGLADPVQEVLFRRSPKLLQKYEGRVLLIATSACAMHCRYCFRRHFDYVRGSFDEEIAAIAADSSVEEVILSGGDPLSLPDEALGQLLDQIDAIAHVKRIRFHTRFPVGIPQRIDEGFLELMKRRAQIIFVLHVNHARELDEEVIASMRKLLRCGIPVLTQSVLLRGVNDDADTLVELCKKLVDHGIMPYYLHDLDPVEGALHFQVPQEEGLQLLRQMQNRLPGYAVPCYVKESPGQLSKRLVSEEPQALLRSDCGVRKSRAQPCLRHN